MTHEQEVATTLIKHLPDDGTLLDIGGNVGRVSEAVKQARPDVAIHLFEPVKKFVGGASARLARFENVTINAFGLSDCDCNLTAYGHEGNPGWTTLDPAYGVEGAPFYKVSVMRLDDYPLSACDVIKIDVEYWQGKVLKGARSTINRFMPVIFCEVSRGSEDLWYESVGEFERLFDIGYERLDYRMSGRHDRLFMPVARKR